MNPERLLQFVSPTVIAEVHHLCKTPACTAADGRRDEGWTCRLQAYLMGLALSAERIPCVVVFGRAGFVVGPAGEHPPVGIDVDPHAWVMVERNGTLDVSPTFDHTDSPLMREWGSATILRDRCLPSGNFIMARSDQEFENEVARASYAETRRTAIYLGKRYDEMDQAALDNGALIAGAGLTDEIVANHSEAVLLAAGRDLYELARGRAMPLTTKSRDSAWQHLADKKHNDRGWFTARMRPAKI